MKKTAGTILMVITGFCLNSSLVNDDKANTAGRETIETIKGETGIVKQIGEGETAVYMISCTNRPLRLNVYNLPRTFKKHGQLVTFTGNIKASSTLEDDFGELFEITAIQ
jgi:hypothetical protein